MEKSQRMMIYVFYVQYTFFLKYGFQGDYTSGVKSPDMLHSAYISKLNLVSGMYTGYCTLFMIVTKFLPMELKGLHACKCLLDVNIAEHHASTIASLKFKLHFFQNNNY